MAGMKFGRWIVIERIYSIVNKNLLNPYWLCECSCEERTRRVVRGSDLTSSRSKSCGCWKKEERLKRVENLTGHKFGILTVVSVGKRPNNSKDRSLFWECFCDCSPDVSLHISANALKNGHTKSCGCLKIDSIKQHFLKIECGNMKLAKI